ncbi:hypothetical protein [Kitasatospora sp. NPDC088548]|uniref:hypothetical protein n=1 Tax=Kitasatospora sp. NPDC088548 TaxID=3364075 RepID=UPI003809D21B
MSFPLPQLASALLGQSNDVRDIPDVPDFAVSGWLATVTEQVLALLATASPVTGAPGSFTTQGYTHLLLHDALPGGATAYLRLPAGNLTTPRPLTDTTVVVTLAGNVILESYRHQQDVDDNAPQYRHHFGPENVFACHAGGICTTESTGDSVQLLLARSRLTPAGMALTPGQYADAVADARALLGGAA